MAIIAVQKNGNLARCRIDPLPGGHLRFGPPLVVPVPAQYPLAFWRFFCAVGDPFDEFFRRVGILQVDLIKLHSATHKVHVCIIEPRQYQFAFCIDDFRVRAMPWFHLLVASNCDNAISQDGDRFRMGLILICGPDICVIDDQIRLRL